MRGVERMKEYFTTDSLVSIIIPVFNGANYLRLAIDSALAQTWHGIEVIVVDDGSNDDGQTRRIAESYGDRIRFVSKANGGVASALNAGIELMNGEWFSWLSHDDLYHPRKVEIQMEALKKMPSGGIAFGDYLIIDEEGNFLDEIKVSGFDSTRSLWAVLEGRLNGCTLLVPRAALVAAEGFHTGLPTTQDYELWFRLAREHRFVHVPGFLVSHRAHQMQGSRVQRHVEEAGLLWSEMLEKVTPAEMRHLAGSELAFLLRASRFLARASYPAGRTAAERLIRPHFQCVKLTVVWCVDSPATFTRLWSALIEMGLQRITVVVGDFSGDAGVALGLCAALPTGVTQVRLWRHEGMGPILGAALAAGPCDLIMTADQATEIVPCKLKTAFEAVLGGHWDGWLQTQGTPAMGLLPSAFRGALFTPQAAIDGLDRCAALEHTNLASTLGLVARLGHEREPRRIIPIDVAAAIATPCEPVDTVAANPEVLPPIGAPLVPAGSHPALAKSVLGLWVLAQAVRLYRRNPRYAARVGPRVASLLGAGGLVDSAAYLRANQDVAAAGFDPTLHYLLHGWREGRDPQPVLTDSPSVPTDFPPVLTDPPPGLTEIHPEPMPSAADPARVEPSAEPAWLLVIHVHGGGTHHYAELVAEQLRRRGIRPIYAWGWENQILSVSSRRFGDVDAQFDLPSALDDAVAYLRGVGVERVDILHAMGLEQYIAPLMAKLDVPYDVTFLDYHLVSVSPHLLGEDGTTVVSAPYGERSILAPIIRPVPAWVQNASRRLACSRDLAARLERLVPGLTVMPVRAPEMPRPERYRVTPPVTHRAPNPLRVITTGAFVTHKGRDVILAVAEEAKRRDLAIEFHHVGISTPVPPERQIGSGLHQYGVFQSQQLADVVCEIRPHVAWFPAQAPETYCFALSDMMLMGLPVLARGIGAFPERLAGRAYTWVTPADRNTCEFWLDQLLMLQASNLNMPAVAPPLLDLPPLIEDFYDKLYVDDAQT